MDIITCETSKPRSHCVRRRTSPHARGRRTRRRQCTRRTAPYTSTQDTADAKLYATYRCSQWEQLHCRPLTQRNMPHKIEPSSICAACCVRHHTATQCVCVKAAVTRCSAIAERPRCRVRYSFRQK